MQAGRSVARAPGTPGTIVLFHDDRRHAQPLQPGAEADAALPAPDDDAIGLPAGAEFGFLPGFALEPALAVPDDPMLDALIAGLALFLLEALELRHRRQQGPAFAVPEAN